MLRCRRAARALIMVAVTFISVLPQVGNAASDAIVCTYEGRLFYSPSGPRPAFSTNASATARIERVELSGCVGRTTDGRDVDMEATGWLTMGGTYIPPYVTTDTCQGEVEFGNYALRIPLQGGDEFEVLGPLIGTRIRDAHVVLFGPTSRNHRAAGTWTPVRGSCEENGVQAARIEGVLTFAGPPGL